MKRWLQIQKEPIDETALLGTREISSSIGAVIYFSGVVREQEGSMSITALEYEAFEKMVEHQFAKIFDRMEIHWPIERVRLVHRVGIVPVNEASLWIEISAPHRGEAFEACKFLIDEMKKVVPIWKQPVHLPQN
jgi:molybdopterin synthase catalytic subunit